MNERASRARVPRVLRAMIGAGLVTFGVSSAPLWGQQINLDRPVRAGDLVLFPDIKEESAFYYVVDKPRLATDERGRPQFSFLRYVENVRSGADEEEAREGEGGGILHCLVSLSVSEEQLREAERALRRTEPGGEIRGPVVFRSGTFGLVSSFADPEGNLSAQVLGLGNAPLLDGEKAAVSMQLTKLGAKILWESFQTPTPDVSFTFEMEVGGYRSPKRALIEADFDRIYSHEAFAVGLATPYLAGEIKGAFDDLVESRAIRVEQVGEDASMESLLTTAYNKIVEMMFEPLGGSGTPSLASLTASAQNQPSVLDRATTLLQQSRAEARTENEAIRRRNQEAERREEAERRRREASSSRTSTATGGGAAPGDRPGETPRPADGGERDELASEEAETPPVSADARRAGVAAPSRPEADEEEEPIAMPDRDGADARGQREEEVPVPTFAAVATFEMKRVRHRGTIRIDLNKYTSDSLTLRFDENIGDLRRFVDDEAHFRQANLDDPLYRQREIVASVDGLNAQDFGEYVNFVTVQMRKRHEGGEETYDEVRIDRSNFNREGNAFKLLYGWKGDANRRRWLEYEVATKWSFFGGAEVEEDWASRTAGAVSLAPPYQRRRVTLEADPDALAEAEVRSITVSVFYELGGREQVKRVTLSPSGGDLSETVEFMLPAEEYEYDYEISWRLRGNRSVSSGRQSTNEAILFVDELPPDA